MPTKAPGPRSPNDPITLTVLKEDCIEVYVDGRHVATIGPDLAYSTLRQCADLVDRERHRSAPVSSQTKPG